MNTIKHIIMIPIPNEMKGISKSNFQVLVLKLFFFLIFLVICEIEKNPQNLS